MATNWHNNDQLYIKFGTNEATPAKAAGRPKKGQDHVVEIDIDLTALADANAIVNDTVKLPKGALITKITAIATEAATSQGSAVLDLGVIDEDRSSNGTDDALLAAAAVANFAAIGDTEEYIQGATSHGALVGAILTKSVYITAGYDTAAFDTGALKIRIEFFMTE